MCVCVCVCVCGVCGVYVCVRDSKFNQSHQSSLHQSISHLSIEEKWSGSCFVSHFLEDVVCILVLLSTLCVGPQTEQMVLKIAAVL